MTQVTEIDIRDLKTAISDLTSSFTGLREEMRIGFANVDTRFAKLEGKIDNVETKLEGKIDILEAKIDNVETKLEGKIDTLDAKIEGKIDKIDAKYDERTKLGFWGFIFRSTALAILAGFVTIFIKYIFPILPTVK